jgi:CubicO group peptidase (beta-lactamase class C family)
MSRYIAATLAVVLLLQRPSGASDGPKAGSPTGDDLAPLLEPIRREYQLPALAAAVVRSDRVLGAGAVGVRAAGKETRVGLDDRFHIGSCTKSMTAILIARLVDQGKLTWDTTLAEALPAVEIRPEYRPVTIRQLLTFRGGIPPYTTFQAGELPATITSLKGDDPADVRLQFVRAVLNEPPAAPPGTTAVYSNAAYAIAGAIIDRLAGRSWEAEIEQALFRPLGMTASVVGPAHTGSDDQPVGHRREGGPPPETLPKMVRKKPSDAPPKAAPGGTFRPAAGTPLTDGPFRHVTAPAGQVSCSILDFARYAQARLAGLRGQGPLLSPEAYAALARSDEQEEGYSGGTGRVRTLGKDGREYQANGSSGLFLAAFRLLPDQDAAIVVAMNGTAPGALAAVVDALKERYQLPK